MDQVLTNLLQAINSDNRKKYEYAFFDLKFIIERFTQNRYEEEGVANYLLLFNDKSLISYRISQEYLLYVKYFLFYILFNCPGKAIYAAKCIKVCFDKESWPAITNGLEIYWKFDDHTTCELIYAIVNLDDQDWYKDEAIVNLFKLISKSGGEFSKQAAIDVLNFYALDGGV